MRKNERAHFENMVKKHEESYADPEVWGPIIAQYLRSSYKHTRVVGSENFEKLMPKQIYVCGGFLDMGKHNYLVTHKAKNYFHETSVNFRKDPIPIVTKGRSNAVVKDRDANVFKFWQKDTPEQLSKAYDLDFGYQKMSGVIKQSVDQEDVKEFLLKHYNYLKDTFLTLIINGSNFPYLNNQDFTRFMKQCDVMDSVLSQS